MSFEYFITIDYVVVFFTGDGYGICCGWLWLMVRALGNQWRLAYVQFIKHWGVGEHVFIRDIQPVFGDDLLFYKGGKGFYDAGDISASDITDDQHKQAAQETYDVALKAVTSGEYDLVICDEINNAVHDSLLTEEQLAKLITARGKKVSLCLTGRNFPESLIGQTDIATNMSKIKHHYDDKYLANKGIDY